MQNYDHPFVFDRLQNEGQAQLAIIQALRPLDGDARRRVLRVIIELLEEERPLTREERFMLNEPPEVVADLPRKAR